MFMWSYESIHSGGTVWPCETKRSTSMPASVASPAGRDAATTAEARGRATLTPGRNRLSRRFRAFESGRSRTMAYVTRFSMPRCALALTLALAVALSARAADIGQVKVAKGRVDVERAGATV